MRALLSALIAFFLALFEPMSASATEEPAHTVVVEEERFQIRAYDPMIVAEVEVGGDMNRASGNGFRPLADYIFGNNTARAEIAMTAPVTRTPTSQKIDMTAPVLREPGDAGSWTVSFVMPSQWTMETLPVPNNPGVSLREVPGEMIAAAEFRGSGTMAAFTRWESELADWAASQGYEIAGPARYAGYSGPWVPGPMKRQEVLIPVTIVRAE